MSDYLASTLKETIVHYVQQWPDHDAPTEYVAVVTRTYEESDSAGVVRLNVFREVGIVSKDHVPFDDKEKLPGTWHHIED